MRKKISFICFTILLLLSISCLSGKKPQEGDEISGTYTFEYPSKELEELVIKEDSTYIKNIYSNKENFLNNEKPIFSNMGEWSINQKNGKLDFKDWLSYCEMGDPNIILPEPQYTYMTGISWSPPNITHNGVILIYDETNYIFRRLKE